MSVRRLLIANRHPRLRIDRKSLVAAVETLEAHAGKFRGGCPPGELSLVFMTDAALANLHAQFLDDPSVTDVITFEGRAFPGEEPEARAAGEICVSADAARRQATISKRPGRPGDFAHELTLYVVHGWLHLAGYDDLQPEKKRAMRRAEARALTLLRTASKMPRFSLRR